MQPKQQVTPTTERSELKKRMVKLKTELRNSKQEVAKLTVRLESIREEKRVHVDEDLYKDLEDIMNERTKEIQNNHPPNSFHQLFWKQQLEAMKVKDMSQVRWHPTCLVSFTLHDRHMVTATSN